MVQVISSAALPSGTAIQSRTLLVYIDTLGPSLFRFRCVHAFFDIRGKVEKRIFNVDIVLSRNLQKWYAELISEPLALLG